MSEIAVVKFAPSTYTSQFITSVSGKNLLHVYLDSLPDRFNCLIGKGYTTVEVLGCFGQVPPRQALD